MTTKTPKRLPKSVTRRPGGRSARIRRSVFDATLALLADSGYQSLTIEGVAAAAGVNKTTVYRNWPTKAKLVQAAAEDRSASIVTAKITGDPVRDLTAFLASIASHVSSPVGQALVIASLNESHDGLVRQARSEFWEARFAAAEALIKSAARGAEVGDARVEAVIEHLIGPLFLRAFITGTPIDEEFIEATARTAAHLVVCGTVD